MYGKKSNLLFFLVWSIQSSLSVQDGCPGPTEPCMNDDNYKSCRQIVDAGCKELLVKESCPVQFGCGDGPETERGPDACVTMLVFNNSQCKGDPVRSMSLSTYSEPGSDCHYDPAFPYFSTKNQYCDRKTGNWHEDVYFGSQDCGKTKRRWYWNRPMMMNYTFAADACVGGLMLDSCDFHPCNLTL